MYTFPPSPHEGNISLYAKSWREKTHYTIIDDIIGQFINKFSYLLPSLQVFPNLQKFRDLDASVFFPTFDSFQASYSLIFGSVSSETFVELVKS